MSLEKAAVYTRPDLTRNSANPRVEQYFPTRADSPQNPEPHRLEDLPNKFRAKSRLADFPQSRRHFHRLQETGLATVL